MDQQSLQREETAPKTNGIEKGGGRVKTVLPIRNRQEAQSSEGNGSGIPSSSNTTITGKKKDMSTEQEKIPCSSTYNLRSRAQPKTDKETSNQRQLIGHPGETSPGPISAHNRPEEKIKPNIPNKSRWTEEEIKELIWCYYYTNAKMTASETDVYETWRERNPNIRKNLDSKKLATQRRYLINSGRVNENQIRKIKSDVGTAIRNEIAQQKKETQERKGETVEDVEVKTKETTKTPLKDEIMTEYTTTMKMSINDRTNLCKIIEDARARALIKQANLAIMVIINESPEMDITQINHLTYATAKIITEKLQPPRKIPDAICNKTIGQNKEPPWAKRIMRKIETLRKDLSLLSEENARTRRETQVKINKIKEKYKANCEEDATK